MHVARERRPARRAGSVTPLAEARQQRLREGLHCGHTDRAGGDFDVLCEQTIRIGKRHLLTQRAVRLLQRG